MSFRLYLDVGNYALKYGARQNGQWLAEGALPYEADEEAEDLCFDTETVVEDLLARLAEAGLNLGQCERAVACSSNPQLQEVLDSLAGAIPCPLLLLGRDLQAKMRAEYRVPEQLGPDRLANAVAAARLYGVPAVVIDLGTCITSEVVGPEGSFLGGAIAAGRTAIMAGILTTAPHLAEALLTQEMPDILGLIGRSTSEGLLIGLDAQIAATADRLALEALEFLDESDVPVVVTGGDSDIVASLTELEVQVDPLLTREGLRLIDEYE